MIVLSDQLDHLEALHSLYTSIADYEDPANQSDDRKLRRMVRELVGHCRVMIVSLTRLLNLNAQHEEMSSRDDASDDSRLNFLENEIRELAEKLNSQSLSMNDRNLQIVTRTQQLLSEMSE